MATSAIRVTATDIGRQCLPLPADLGGALRTMPAGMRTATSMLIWILCACLGAGCLTYRYQVDKPTAAGTAVAAATEVAVGTLFAFVCEDSPDPAADSRRPCPSGTVETLGTGIVMGIGFDLLGLVVVWLIRDID
jgi:hypothetical protein